MIDRHLEPHLINALSEGFVTVLYGARQVGKTTLSKKLLTSSQNGLYLNCDDPVIVRQLQNQSLNNLQRLLSNTDLVVIDEAQRVENIGLTAKLIHDNLPNIKLLLTGSSSLDLANKTKEPLTGRSVELLLYPLGLKEVSKNLLSGNNNLERLLIHGGYPGLWGMNLEDSANRARDIANRYLYKDSFALGTIYDQTVIDNLLRLLAHRIGNEVSYSELATHLEISKETVMRYIDLLEKAFIVFRRPQYRKNQRSLIGRLRKVYFYDLGMRNALIDDFRDLHLRNDVGQLWENFVLVERLRLHQNEQKFVRSYYWRSRDRQEIDLIEEVDQETHAYECKWKKQSKIPAGFRSSYPGVSTEFITKENYWDYI